MVCTFFGHRDSPEKVKTVLKTVLVDLIENNGVNEFLVGNQGAFDRFAINVLKELKEEYTDKIRCMVVYAYTPTEQSKEKEMETIYPEAVATTSPKFAIDRRNRWMIEKANYVVTYVTSPVGGAAKFKSLAEQKNKTIVNLVEK